MFCHFWPCAIFIFSAIFSHSRLSARFPFYARRSDSQTQGALLNLGFGEPVNSHCFPRENKKTLLANWLANPDSAAARTTVELRFFPLVTPVLGATARLSQRYSHPYPRAKWVLGCHSVKKSGPIPQSPRAKFWRKFFERLVAICAKGF